jgi:hypothetical protein
MIKESDVKTNQIIKRPFFGGEVSQRTKDGFFSATDLLKTYNTNAGKQKVLPEFWSNKGTSDFIEALENQLATETLGESLLLKTYNTNAGRSGGTWMHPYLFVKFAMWLSAEFEVKIIKWVYDNLLEERNQAGDHYKEMCQAIADKYEEFYAAKPDPLIFAKEISFLNRLVFGSPAAGQRNTATVEQLELMNKLQLANIKMINGGLSKEERQKNLQTFAALYK